MTIVLLISGTITMELILKRAEIEDKSFLIESYVDGSLDNNFHPNMSLKPLKTNAYVECLLYFQRDGITGNEVNVEIAWSGNTPVGILISEIKGNEKTISAIHVHKGYRGVGVGKFIVLKFLENSFEFKRVTAYCRESSEKFKSLLLLNGFREFRNDNGVIGYELHINHSSYQRPFSYNF